MPTPRVPVRCARLRAFSFPEVPATVDRAFDAAGAAIVSVAGAEGLLRGTDVWVVVLRGAAVEVWQMSGIPDGLIPEDDLVRAVASLGEGAADTVVVARRFAGLDPEACDTVGIRYFLERSGQRAWAVLHFHEVGTPRPAEPRFVKSTPRPAPPGHAWLGVAPDPAIFATLGPAN